jgi:alpha-mannosidase
VTFKLAPADGQKPNAVTCNGQTINLPEGKFNRLYLLAAAANAGDEGVKATFKVGEKPAELTIQDWGGFVGLADTRIWKGEIPELTYDWKGIELAEIKPGFIKPAKVAWFSTHRHDPEGKNELYNFSYLYKYSVDVKPGTKTLTLPDAKTVHVLAVTVADNKNDAIRPAAPLMDRLNRRDFDGKQYTWKFTEYKKTAKPVANALP